MIGDEKRVIEAFCDWLIKDGWSVSREDGFIDVVAKRGDEQLFAEAKGRTAAIGLDLDTLYGQLLRRMPKEAVAKMRFGVVIPEEARRAALRVPHRIRDLLQIDIFLVDHSGQVRQVKDE